MLTLGHLPTIFRANKGSQQIPLPDLFDYSSRSGLNLVDALGGSNATILGGKGTYFGGVGKLVLPSYLQFADGSSYFIEFHLTNASTSTTTVITANTLGANRSSRIRRGATSLDIYNDANQLISFANVFPTNARRKIKLVFNANRTISLYVNDVFISTSTATASNATGWVAIGDYNITGVNAAFEGSMDYFNFNNQCIYYLNNNYCSVTGQAASKFGTLTNPLVSTFTPQSTTDALADGYFQLSGGEQVVKPQFTLPVGAVNHVGGQVHNLISSFVTFPAGSSMDRSNTTIFNATCRASIYYDSSNPRRWHVSELNYDTMQTYLQSAYTNTRFASIKTNYLNQLYIDRFFAFAAPISGKTLTYYLTQIGK